MQIRWRVIMKYWFITLLSTLLLSCAPQYETRYELIPPKNVSALQCLKPCEAKLQQCNMSCTQRFDACSVKAAQQAQLELPKRMQEYEVALAVWRERYNHYLQDKMHYDMRRDQARAMRELCLSTQSDPKACPHTPHMAWSDRPIEPENKPEPPTLVSLTNTIREATCQRNCQCDDQYRSCYSSCGGGVKPHQICVKNCN